VNFKIHLGEWFHVQWGEGGCLVAGILLFSLACLLLIAVCGTVNHQFPTACGLAAQCVSPTP
jgi:hypothetical protein